MDLLKEQIDKSLEQVIKDLASSDKELELLEYVFKGGKRLRPMICLAVGASFQQELPIQKIAVAIEIIHNASLIIDDLPCMDNDLYRRDQPTIHYKYGETVAIQVALKLMAVALNLLFKTVAELPNSSSKLYGFNKIIYQNLGREGLPLGQYLDINLLKNHLNHNKKQYKDLIFKKTTTLFNLSFMLALALYTADEEKLAIMEKASKWFGLSFQIYDDFLDVEQDMENNSPNFIVEFGRETASQMFHKSVKKSKGYLASIGIQLEFFEQVFAKLQSSVQI